MRSTRSAEAVAELLSLDEMSKELSVPDVYEALSTMILAIRDDEGLSKWFHDLSGLSAVARRNEVYRMRDKLMLEGDTVREDMAASLLLLADDRVFQAAQEAIGAG